MYLVTGIAGFIGSNIARKLIERGESVRGLDDFSTGKPENLQDIKDHIEFMEGSILDARFLRDACSGVEFVFHEAAIASVPKSCAEPELTNAVNVNGTLNVLVAARDAGARRVVFAASSSAYGDNPVQPKTEDMLPSPVSPYAVQKLAGENYMQCFSKVYALETVCLRYFNIFGPYQDAGSQYSGVLAKFITQMLAGETPTIFGDGEQSRDFTYIENAVEANLRACEAPAEEVSGRIFNIATGRTCSLKETYQVLQSIVGFDKKPRFEDPRAGDVRHSLADIAMAKRWLGYSPKVDFVEGLRRTVCWYRQVLPALTEPHTPLAG